MDYVSVAEAKDAAGLRLVLTAGVPGPWGESAKSILAYKGLGYTAVEQQGGGENRELFEWTGQNSAPVAVFEDLPPACHWLDLLMLTERLAPEKPLLPESPAPRAQAIGLCALLAGAEGFAWQRRLQMFAPMMAMEEPPEMIARMAHKYGWPETALAQTTDKMLAITSELDSCLAAQQENNADYFIGERVTAVDFYWANFAGMIKPLGPEDNPMPDYMRATYERVDEATAACLTPRLEAHRDMMYKRHIALPLDY